MIPVTTIFIAGLATKASNFLPFLTVSQVFPVKNNPIFIAGAHKRDGELIVSLPSQQVRDAKEYIKSSDNEILIIAHCFGAIAAIEILKEYPNKRIKIIAIAPPLPDPTHVMNHPKILSRIINQDGVRKIPTYSYSFPASYMKIDNNENLVTVGLERDFERKLTEETPRFLGDVKELTKKGSMKIVSPAKDWNKESVKIAKTLGGVLSVDNIHSLYGEGEDGLKEVCQQIYAMYNNW